MKPNNQYNNKEAQDVNTRGQQFMNSDGTFKSTLILGFWNNLISIRIHPVLEPHQQSESKKFNYESSINTAITIEKATTLYNAILNDIIPSINNESKFKAVPVGVNSLIGVGNIFKDGKNILYLAIYKNIDENTKKPSSYLYYEFKQSYTVDDYNETTGEFTISEGIPSEILLFANLLKASCDALSNGVVHSMRYADRWFRDLLISGNTNSKKNSNNYSTTKSNDIFSDSKPMEKTINDDFSTNVEKLNNIDELNSFM